MKNIKEKNSQKQALSQVLMALPITALVFAVIIIILLLGYEVVYANKVYPGVHVYDLDLSGMTREETDQRLAEALQFVSEGSLTLTYEDQSWEAQPMDLGYRIDSSASAEKAYQVGRRGWLPTTLVEKGRAWFTGVQISPVAIYDERMALNYLQSLAEEINQPVVEASLGLENTEVVVISGQVGREVDISTTLSLIKPALASMQSVEIPLVVVESQPVIKDVGPQAEMARRILSQPLVLTALDDGEQVSWTIPPADLASMLTITRVEEGEAESSTYQIAINRDIFGVYLRSLASGLYVEPINTRFIFNDDTGQLDVEEPAIIGRELDVSESMDHINEQLIAGAHEIDLQFTRLSPAVTDDMTGEELGITELVHQETSYFHGSPPARVQNIRAASARFHGLLIAPGETFSMAQALGNISLDNGYAEALIIYGGQTIQGVGGGVCQVSTTLFRAAFFAGFPIVERHAHSYRVSYYEQRSNGSRDPRLAGLDATVYVPIVDFKFTNDTDHWLLMETYVVNFSLTWKFYSTSDGRTMEWTTTGPTNIVPAPDPIYQENPELETGQMKQIDYAADGANVSVTRTVYMNDKVYFSDSFNTYFRPWQAIYEYGPGTEGIPESD